MKIGYARVSTADQTISLQQDALKAAGCEQVFADQGISGTVSKRPGLDRALKALQPGDTLVVWKLDRLGRSLSHLVQLVADLGGRGISFRSLSDPIDTASAGGRLVLHMMGALAEFERSRKPSLTSDQIAHARQLVESGEHPRTVARSFHVGRATLYRHFQKASSP
jgi:DNA invertase Pin-like site-specific DNA recombinase